MTNASNSHAANERTMQQWHPRFCGALSLLHYHLLHFTVLRVPIGCLRGQISILHILQISVTFFRYRLHFSDIGYIFQISVMILICIARGDWVGVGLVATAVLIRCLLSTQIFISVLKFSILKLFSNHFHPAFTSRIRILPILHPIRRILFPSGFEYSDPNSQTFFKSLSTTLHFPNPHPTDSVS